MPQDRGRVLVVDDDEDIRSLLAMILDEAGFQVDLAEDGTRSLALVDAVSPDLIFLDLKMPGLDGWGVLDRLNQSHCTTPVVVVSGAYEQIARGTLGPPVAGVLLKPFRVEEVVRTARTVLEARRHGSPQAERRRDPRRPLVVEGKLLGRDGNAIALGTIVDVSLQGAQFQLGIPLEPGRRVQVALDIPGMDGPVVVLGEIRWSRAGALGLEFRDLGPDQLRHLQELLEG